MALSKLSGDEQCIIFSQLCNVLDSRIAVAFSSANSELWALTQAQRQQLRADHDVAAVLGRKVGMRSCKELREAKLVNCKGLSVAELLTLGRLGSVLPALDTLILVEDEGAAGTDGLERLVEGLGAGALPAVTYLLTANVRVGNAGASALAAALGRGALPRLKVLLLGGTAIGMLNKAAIGDAGLLALAPALRRLPALDHLVLWGNPFGDEGLAALVAPPPPAGVLTKLKTLDLSNTQVTNAGCAPLAEYHGFVHAPPPVADPWRGVWRRF